MSIQNYVCGFDEVGKGALAGPVVVASVVFFMLRDAVSCLASSSPCMCVGPLSGNCYNGLEFGIH